MRVRMRREVAGRGGAADLRRVGDRPTTSPLFSSSRGDEPGAKSPSLEPCREPARKKRWREGRWRREKGELDSRARTKRRERARRWLLSGDWTDSWEERSSRRSKRGGNGGEKALELLKRDHRRRRVLCRFAAMNRVTRDEAG